MSWEVLDGDCRDVLPVLPAGSVHTCITSPPYFGLRDYGTGEWDGGDPACDHTGARRGHGDEEKQARSAGTSRDGQIARSCRLCGATRIDRQIGLEPTPDEFVQALVGVFREVRRVLRDDGTVWLNLGDSYAGGTMGRKDMDTLPRPRGGHRTDPGYGIARDVPVGLKPKDLIGVPWMVAFALRADGWYLRSDIIWSKPNPMPESVTDRPTRSHEYVFLLSKSARYFYDADAIREPLAANTLRECSVSRPVLADPLMRSANIDTSRGANKRSVWTVATQPYNDAHFATFPPKLIEPCVLAGCPEGGTVLDPFAGAGTTGLVAIRNRRSFVGIELNPGYAQMARDRTATDIRLGYRRPTRVTHNGDALF